jgi:hypothetical protein
MQFDVKMTTGLLYDYLLRQAFTSLAGWITLALSAVMFGLYFTNGSLILLFVGLIGVFYTPVYLYGRAKLQMQINKSFKSALHYRVDQNGIEISQGGEAVRVEWEQLYKAVATRRSILVFTSRHNAWIFPYKDLGEQRGRLVELIKTHMGKKARLRGK